VAAAAVYDEKQAAVEFTRAEKLLTEARSWTARHASSALHFDIATKRAEVVWSAVPPLSEVISLSEAAERTKREADLEANQVSAVLASTLSSLVEQRTEAERLRVSKATIERSLEEQGVNRGRLNEWALHAMDERVRQSKAPWHDDELWVLRHKVFAAAVDLHKSFLASNRDVVLGNLRCMLGVLTGDFPRYSLNEANPQTLWNTLFLVVSVVSTTFASLSRVFEGLGRESLGWLIIDEAGQATPQAAVGGIWRARRAVVVGDPLQVEPVVTVPEDAIDLLRKRCGIGNEWHPIRCSAQVLADRANPLGMELAGKWLGAPLRVHRRCLDLMFRVANAIAYENMMVHGTIGNDAEWLGDSCWIHVPASNATKHWIPAQGDIASRIVHRIAELAGLQGPERDANVYVISPFRMVSENMRGLLADTPEIREALRTVSGEDDEEKLKRIVGTVHTFQGKEAPVVVLLLGGDPTSPRAITGYAARTPNILNVALTRAKTKIYIVGDYYQWSSARYFRTLAEVLGEAGTRYLTAEQFAKRANLGPPILRNPVGRVSAQQPGIPLPEAVSVASQPGDDTAISLQGGTRPQRPYAVALSFAGEDRDYVEAVASSLQEASVSVFYDGYEEAGLWGKNLYSHLRYIYEEAAEYTVVFVSRSYAQKLWTSHELESAQARAFGERREYILPARFDDTHIPGIPKTVGYIDLRKKKPEDLAALIVKKIDEVRSHSNARHSG
jgi:hypothetical protein